jgi:MerR family transcriptional regulator, light-induced transcriptional regulator
VCPGQPRQVRVVRGAAAIDGLRPSLSIKSVARIANLSIDTIRAWEKRYRAIVPERAHGGRRVFSSRDVERLILLRDIVATGVSISRVASCATTELRGMARIAAQRGESDDAEVVRILRSIRTHDVSLLSEELLQVALVRSAAEFGDDVVAAVLSEIERDPDLRQAGELLLASALVSSSSLLFAKYRTARGPVMISLTLPGEHHAIPPLLAALVSSEAGFEGMYVGTQIEPADIEALVKDLSAVGVVIHAGMESFEHMQAALRLRNKLPHIRLIMTGRGGSLAPPDVATMSSLRELAVALRYN